MCLLVETIRIVNGVPQNLAWHEARVNRSMNEIWGTEVPLSLQPWIIVPMDYLTGTVRCNVYYGTDIREVKFQHYAKRSIRTLKMVPCAELDYHLKYADRSKLESLYKLRGTCDEIIIVKNGLITDTSMSNLAFFDGTTWSTPAKPLLEGTCRNRLIAAGWLVERDIRSADLHTYTGCKLINAMRDPDDEDMIPVANIV